MLTDAHPASRSDDLTYRLLEDGYCIIPDLLDPAAIEALAEDMDDRFTRTPFCEGAFYGARTKRFGRLLARSSRTSDLVQHPTILEIANNVLAPWCDRIQLNVAQAIAVHPGSPQQLPHRDEDMWPVDKGEAEFLINVIWPLTPFTADNGATRVWPGSHRAAHYKVGPEAEAEAVAAVMQPGSALVFLGSTLHGAGANLSDADRRGIVIGYSLGWLKAYENQSLAYPPAVAKHFSPALAALVGYAQHRPNLGNYEGQCPSVLLGEHVPDLLAAIDALRPDQQDMINAFLDQTRGGG